MAMPRKAFTDIHSVFSNLATLNCLTELMQRNVYVGVLYPYVYYTLIMCSVCGVVYNITWRGLAALLILETGQC